MTETAETATADPGAQIDGGERTDLPEGKGTDEAPKDREARYRVERNQAREELAAANVRIETYQTREVHRLANELAQPSDLLELGGVSLADLLDGNGEVDPEAVAQAVSSLIETRPGLAKNPKVRAVDPSQGMGGQPGRAPVGWEALFRK
ncbi:hypothetical protein ACKUUI_05985 [Mycobacterium seoulense]|uniref:hypothetical protein n=1 Tax=Mycobacterium seoulense TaxID=386911 RepID=UPI003CEF38E2